MIPKNQNYKSNFEECLIFTQNQVTEYSYFPYYFSMPAVMKQCDCDYSMTIHNYPSLGDGNLLINTSEPCQNDLGNIKAIKDFQSRVDPLTSVHL